MSGDGYRPGRVVTERGDLVMLACGEGHAFGVKLVEDLSPMTKAKGRIVKHCPFCGDQKLQEI